MNAGGRSVKGQWSQRRDRLTIFFDVPAIVPGQRRIDREPANRETALTIDLVNDTTLVLSGPMLQRPDGTATFLRVK